MKNTKWLAAILATAIPTGALAQEGGEATEEDGSSGEGEVAAVEEERAALERRVAELEAAVAALSAEAEEDELAEIVAAAEVEAKAPEEEARPEEREFLWGALALQKLNPELSVSGDFVAGLIIDDDARFYAGADDRSVLLLREAALHFQHLLDPYSMFKAAIAFAPEPYPAIELEEMYITWFGIGDALSLTLGRFRQNFGILNRWHEHDLDQVEFPLALTGVLGEEGLCQTGLVLRWFMPPLIASANELTIELSMGENETLFAGEFFSIPTALLHLKNYYDINEATYLELGLTGMWGVNNRWGYVSASDELADEPWRHTWLAGADLTLQWSPPTRAKYRSVTWRSEGYFAYKETPTAAGSVTAGTAEPDGDRISWGAYSYLDVQLHTKWFAGVRGDLVVPTVRVEDDIAWDVVPYLTFWQSEFVYFRLEYRHGEQIPYERPDGSLARRTDDRILLQVDWAAGPHKHEKY